MPALAPVVLAFSGGLDTSFCVPYLAEETSRPIHAVTVQTGGFSAEELAEIERRAMDLGAASFAAVDAREALWARVLRYLVKGTVLRGSVYPLCVGPERVVQAEVLVAEAMRVGATAVAHGSTGAGNDQIRFDGALRLLAAQAGVDLEILAPIRTLGLSREATTDYLIARGIDVPARTTAYSINRGLWGTTIGGQETHRTDGVLPESAWPDTASVADAPDRPLLLTLAFEKGLPVALDGAAIAPVALLETLHRLGAEHGVGRGMHVGDTILGIKGRVAFEAPAAAILLPAHRELEKLVLTRHQLVQVAESGDRYGRFLHEGHYFDPAMRDLEALLDSSQRRVTGEVDVRLFKGHAAVLGARSPHSLFDAGATYGETHELWDGRDAAGFARLHGLQALLAARAQRSMGERERGGTGEGEQKSKQF